MVQRRRSGTDRRKRRDGSHQLATDLADVFPRCKA
jgi:hypothetical protein